MSDIPEIKINSVPRYRAATVGMFDGVHLGHRHVLGRLCSIAAAKDLTPTVFTFDRHPLEEIAPDKAPLKLTTPAQRTAAIVDCGVQDVFILVFNKHIRMLAAEDFLEMLHHDYGVTLLLLGFNHRFGHDSRCTFDEYREMGRRHGIEVVKADEVPGETPVSSSLIREALADGNIAAANSMLGAPFTIRGKVVRGHGIGRTIGFPTANIKPAMQRQMLPAPGVYAAVALLPNGHRRRAMVNIGINPTIDDGNTEVRVEAHIIGWEGDLYGKPVELQFVTRLRDEQRFRDIDELRAHLAADRADTIRAVKL